MNNTKETPLILLFGCSGSGKDTIADILSKMYGYKKLRSYTTRPKRNEDEDTHIFVEQSEFDNLKNNGLIAAYSNYNGYDYGATVRQAEEADIYIIDIEGIKYFKEHYTGNRTYVTVFINADEEVRFDRIAKRENIDKANERVLNDRIAFKDAMVYADYTFDNNTALVKAVKGINSIIKKQLDNNKQKQHLVYISHPFQNKLVNLDDICKIIRQKIKEYPTYTFISPVHCFGFLYKDVDYDLGLEYCLQLLSRCDEMWVFGDYEHSTGCMAEIEYCEKYNMPYSIKR